MAQTEILRENPGTTGFSQSETHQKEHFDTMASDYEAHFDDPYSQRYRTRFFNTPMLEGINLSGLQVLEAMCGSGQTTDDLLSRGASVTGLDISDNLIASFKKRHPDCKAICASILNSDLESETFDCVVVVGGLHHIHPYVQNTIAEIHRLLKPGGYFCFTEPHRGSFPDWVRQKWYKNDSLFEDNEASIDFEDLKAIFASKFSVQKEQYGGNLAYLLVLNSLIFRIPLWLKPVYASPLTRLETALSKIQNPFLSCFITGQWQKRDN